MTGYESKKAMAQDKLESMEREALAQEPKSVTYNEVADSMNSLRKGNLSQQAAAEEVGKLKLYTTPPQRPWVGLTEKEKKEIYRLSVYVEGAISLTEAKLKDKNNG